MTDDLISRQAVNEIINDIRDCISVEGYWAIIERMKKLPPVNPQEPKWIPVSERLPKDRNTVLVTAYWHETYQVMEAFWYDGDDVWWCVPFNNCGEHMRNDLHVIAWMPLPKPYKAESEDKG